MLQLSCDNKSNRMLSKSAMSTVTQITRRRQAIIEYSKNKGVTAAARRYNVSRQYIYRWRNRYNGTLESLKDRSHRPHSHPKQHTPEELKLIENMRKRNAHTGLVVLWVKPRQKGYTRSITSLWRMLKKRNLMPVKPPNPKYVPKPYEKMSYPGQRVQIDVKFVPESCIVCDAKAEGKKFYQYTAIDEYSRYRYLEAFVQPLYLASQLPDLLSQAHCVFGGSLLDVQVAVLCRLHPYVQRFRTVPSVPRWLALLLFPAPALLTAPCSSCRISLLLTCPSPS